MTPLLKELRESPTDLARLVEHVLARKMSVLMLTFKTVAAWEQRAPEVWAKAQKWLTAQNVKIVIIPPYAET